MTSIDAVDASDLEPGDYVAVLDDGEEQLRGPVQEVSSEAGRYCIDVSRGDYASACWQREGRTFHRLRDSGADDLDGEAVEWLQAAVPGNEYLSLEYSEVVTVEEVHEPDAVQLAAGVVPADVELPGGHTETTTLNELREFAVWDREALASAYRALTSSTGVESPTLAAVRIEQALGDSPAESIPERSD